MEYAHILLSLAVVDFLAVATPGPNFMLVSQVSTTASRTQALFVVGGLLVANISWCAAVFLGLAVIFTAAPVLHSIVQIGGAAYLIYLAISLWKTPRQQTSASCPTSTPVSNKKGNGFLRGWFVGMSNPKSLAYFSSVFTVFLPTSSSSSLQAMAVAVVALNTVLWYGAVALLLSIPSVQQAFLRWQTVFNRIAGAALGVFGTRLLLVKADA